MTSSELPGWVEPSPAATAQPYVCPTPCDVDCEGCHEWHDIARKRSHDPIECEARQRGWLSPDLAAERERAARQEGRNEAADAIKDKDYNWPGERPHWVELTPTLTLAERLARGSEPKP